MSAVPGARPHVIHLCHNIRGNLKTRTKGKARRQINECDTAVDITGLVPAALRYLSVDLLRHVVRVPEKIERDRPYKAHRRQLRGTQHPFSPCILTIIMMVKSSLIIKQGHSTAGRRGRVGRTSR